MSVQTPQEKQSVIEQWEHSALFNPRLIQSNHNISVISQRIATMPHLTVENLAATIERLIAEDRLELAPEPVVVPEPYVLRTPEGAPITTKAELVAYINVEPKATRKLLYGSGTVKNLEAEAEFNRLLSQPSQPNAEKAAERKRKIALDAAGIRRGSDTEPPYKRPAPTEVETANQKNISAANQNAARLALDSIIDQQIVSGGSGRVNHTATHQLKERLRAIKVLDTKSLTVDYIATLSAVGNEIRKSNRNDSSIR